MEVAKKRDMDDIVNIILTDEIGHAYYPNRSVLISKLEHAIEQEEVFLYRLDGQVAGIMWYMENGMFGIYPYLHIIIVREEYRSKGIGLKMMEFLQSKVEDNNRQLLLKKIFLLVNMNNQRAFEFYSRIGYERVCEFKQLFRKNKTEILMIKFF
jgi:ribosomal protein S18 acetylase RimI-like enzyme